MSTQLSPVIVQKLEAFSRRWRKLVLTRGAAEGVVSFLGGMTVVSLVDRVVILPEGVRYCLSIAVYAATGAVVWFGCLRHLRRVPNPREVARMVEKIKPDLREDLISAVELADADSAEWDSPVFRKLLQDDVTRRVEKIEIDELLPNRLISRWLLGSVGVVMACGFLALAPGLGFTRLMARAMAPMANIERVSSVKIKLLEPVNGDAPVPRGDPIPFVVELGGPEVERAYLEIVQPDGRTERITMNAAGGHRFTASANVANESLEYRIRAGDALTRYYKLSSLPRPHVAKFHKTYEFPAYAQMPAQTVSEDHGDLTALEGSSVTVKIAANQKIKEGSLQVEQAGRKSEIPLTRVTDTEWAAAVPMTAAGTYTVKLISAETGFENKFSPQYEIRPGADLLPLVSIDQPAKDQVLPPDEVLDFSATAKDDLALTQVNQMVRVNEGPWQSTPLLTARTNETTLARKWDLLDLKLVPGDRVTTKLVAVDVKGNRAESIPLTLQISSPGLDPKRLKAMQAQREFLRTLDSLEQISQNLRAIVGKEGGKDLKQGEALARQQVLSGARSALEEVDRQIAQVEQRLKEALPQAAAGREAADLSLVGHAISAFKNEHITRARAEFEQLAMANTAEAAKLEPKELLEQVNHAYGIAEKTSKAFNDILSSTEAGLTSATLQYLNGEQQKALQPLTLAPSDAAHLERLTRREEGATREVQVVENLMMAMGNHMPKHNQERVKRLQEALLKSRAPIEKTLTEKKTKDILWASRELQKGIDGTMQQFNGLEQELARNAVKAREYLAQFAKKPVEKLDLARKAAEQVAQDEKKVAELKEKNKPAEKETAKLAESKEKLERDWKAATEQLKDRAKWEELRKDADSQFVADASKTAQALSAMRAATSSETKPQQTAANLKQIQEAYQKLEGAHTLTELNQSARQMANQERYENKELEAATQRPKDWEWLNQKLQNAPKDLEKAQLSEATRKAAQQALNTPQTQEIQKEMSQRQSPARPANSVADEFDKLASNIKQAQDAAQTEVNAARQQIAATAPKLSEMMAGLAEDAKKLEAQTQQAAEKGASNAAEMQDVTRKQLAEQKELTEQVKELQDAIRRDANTQDITSKEGRDRSRDADDAAAMLREPPPKAEAALREAMMARDAAEQKAAMQSAAQQQKQLSKALEQLAQHYENTEAGKAELSRAELRKNEEELGIKGALDSQYNKAEQLAQMQQKSPDELIRELEKELATNEPMRKELDKLADASLDSAKASLQKAAQTEDDLAKSLENVTKANEQRGTLGEQMKQLAQQADQLGKNEVPGIRMDAANAKTDLGKELDRSSQALQQAANNAPKDLSKVTPQQAQQAQEMVKPLQEAANDLRTAAGKADQTLKNTSPTDGKAASAQSAKSKSEAAANKAQQLASQAQNLADMLKTLANSNSGELSKAAAAQKPIADDVAMAGADIARSGRHEARLGTKQGEALQKVGKQTQEVGEKALPTTAEQVAKATSVNEAKPAVDTAKKAVDGQLAELQKAMANAAAPAPAQQSSATPDLQSVLQELAPAESQWKARTLDRLDQAMNSPSSQQSAQQAQQGQQAQSQQQQQGQKGQQQQNGQGQESQSGQQSAQQAAQQAMADAAKAQQQSMAQARNSGQTPGLAQDSESPGDGMQGGFKAAKAADNSNLPDVEAMWTGEWGKLPPKMAEGLLEARRENLSGEYRTMVETYFKVLAERARTSK